MCGLHLQPAQWGDVWVLLDRLNLAEPLLTSFVQRPWTTEVMAVLTVIFKLLLAGNQAAFDMGVHALKSPSCGALCELQVLCVIYCLRG